MLGTGVWRSFGAVALTTVTMLGAAPELGTSVPNETYSSDEEVTVLVTTTGQESLQDIVGQIVNTQGPAVAEIFVSGLSAALETEGAIELPGLAPGTQINESLLESMQSESNTNDSSLPDETLEPIATSASSPSTVPVQGTAINNKRSWQVETWLQRFSCTLLVCTETDRRYFRFTIDPGNTSTRISSFQNYFPSTGRIGTPTFRFTAFRNQSENGSRSFSPIVGSNQYFVAHSLAHRGNGFTMTFSGSASVDGSVKSLPLRRTGWGSCTSATEPTCTYN